MFRRVIPWLSSTGFQCVRKMNPLLTKYRAVPTNFTRTQQIARCMCTTKGKFECINIQDEDDFKKNVIENSKPVVVDFHAT